ncbi:DUF1501 domain-containing protein [Rhodopirellula sallentina]|uniref:Protein containing DUF1501 n=1 Tax=Rhodopirellula sallentina SM41 TaxID=1263870 RepID=M5U746_9BACT|nr:DUF1501 domain-containing protein [Rhodopirellula sallentina]EMI51768.1 protein containing DUF1501 [Rhodopirellula sallentina SM41]
MKHALMNPSPAMQAMLQTTRRHFFGRAATGLGAAALSSVLERQTVDASQPQFPNHPAKAKRVIYLYMSGGPSQFETFDDKPMLRELNGKPIPKSLTEGVKLAFLQYEALKCFGTDIKFQKCGESGQSISDVLPHLQKVADDLCVIRTLQTDQVNHDPAHTFMNTGFGIAGRPSMGSWLSYGLGSEAADLPDFVVMRSGPLGQPIPTTAWHNGFLPGKHQGVEFYGSEQPLNYLKSPSGIDRATQARSIESIAALNRMHYDQSIDEEVLTRIDQYELAFQMQTSVPDLANFASETTATRELYGVGDKPDGSFASNCLMARRMAEGGVRFIQLYHTGWDHHGGVVKGVKSRAKEVDQGCAALIEDLKQRGMLDDTLVIWGGEFGRTPMSQGGSGRDHHTKSGAMWMAGGGINAGTSYGETDDFGFTASIDPFHVHDFHATVLHLMGINHKRLTYRHQGFDFRLTNVHGNVIEPLLG